MIQHAAAHGLTSLPPSPVSFLSSLALYTRVLRDYRRSSHGGGGRLCSHVKGYAHTYDPNVSHVILIFSVYKDCMYTVHTSIVLSLSIPLPRPLSYSHPPHPKPFCTHRIVYLYVILSLYICLQPLCALLQRPAVKSRLTLLDLEYVAQMFVCVCVRASARAHVRACKMIGEKL